MLAKLFITLALISSFSLFGEIIETNEIGTVHNYARKHSMVLFNVTGTLYEPSCALADRQWRDYFACRVQQNVADPLTAELLINKIKNLIVQSIPKKTVEASTPEVIKNLQQKKIPVLGITKKAQKMPYADDFGLITHNHLKYLGINLEATLSYLTLKEVQAEIGYSFAYGMIFTNKQPVGPSLVSFLNRVKHFPSKIIMIDNSLESLESSEIALAPLKIEFIGLRYGRADTNKDQFDPILGIIQFFAFLNTKQIMSDEEARQFKQEHPKIDFEAQLDRFIQSAI